MICSGVLLYKKYRYSYAYWETTNVAQATRSLFFEKFKTVFKSLFKKKSRYR
jgi:hypothetical protein